MSIYQDYIKEIEGRKSQGLSPKPIDDDKLLVEIIKNIQNKDNIDRKKSINFFIYNTLPGTTGAAFVKAKFLKEIITGECLVEEINQDFAFE